ncbi:potassium channel family protein [Amycolatopsis sp. NPDC058986]|uniref:potassium channel family protein n=1 Tax=unclassified Amycolatopsis TaxID=2618356 RepID=UPI003671C8C8
MFGIAIMVTRLVAALRASWRDHASRGVIVSLVTLLISATVFYTVAEGWSPLDSFYFAICTGLTIGYGDLAPTTALAKVFTIAYALLSIGLFVTFAANLASAVVTNRRDTVRRLHRRRKTD